MKVFISWSGAVSHKVAVALHDWLPNVIQAIVPYVSSEDIDKGARWSIDVSRELEDSSFGILVLTPENIAAPWLNFEAGALAKSLEQSRVAPLLFGVQQSDVTGPLVQFQAVRSDKSDVKRLLQGLNQACGDRPLDETRLDEIFEVWWPRLETQLSEIANEKPASTPPAPRSPEDLLTEVLELVRGQQKVLSDPAQLLPPEYVEFAVRRARAQPMSQAALRDLEDAYFRLEALIEDPPENVVASPEIRDAVERLSRPVSYLVRNLRRPQYRPRRPPAAAQDETAIEEDA